MERIYKIYRLTFSNGMQYVGLTINDPVERVKQHSTPGRACNKRLYDLLQDEWPQIDVLKTAKTPAEARWQEQHEIAGIPAESRLNVIVHGVSGRVNTGADKGVKSTQRGVRCSTPREGAYRCSKCYEHKDWTEFYRDRTRFNGLHSRCKKCADALKKKTYWEFKRNFPEKYQAFLERKRRADRKRRLRNAAVQCKGVQEQA